ncbi:sensor histidine kinase [Pontibacter rugosus]|uniref:histidine kinase n=1 Tax=Pontibacter rugosus TaxID=1745966 RepID=A0ABW3SW46_9BACT
MKLLTKIYLAFGFILLVFVFVTVSYVIQSKAVKEEVQLALHSSEIIRLSETIEKAIIDTETGVRGFQISDNENFLQPYHSGRKTYQKTYLELQTKLKDAKQEERLAAIDSSFNHWLKYFGSRSITLQRRSLANAADAPAYEDFRIHVVRQGVGRNIMDSIRQQIAVFEAEEIRQRNERMSSLEQTLKLTDTLAIALTIICIAVAIVIIQLLVNSIRQRLDGISHLAQEIASGHLAARVQDSSNDEISKVSQSLNVMAVKLEDSFTNMQKVNKELDQFAYVVSHDLKAPLRAINSLAEWIEEDLGTGLDPDIKRNLELMRGRVLRMQNLINGILDYSRIGRKELPKQHISSYTLVAEVAESVVAESNVEVHIATDMPDLITEHVLLQQVFSNLISNAIKYNDKPTPVVNVGYRLLKDEYEFWVEDNGPGIPEGYHQKVFGIFQTMEARDTKESTGIGLAIVQKIVHEKGGSIKLASVGGHGSRFTFTWPIEKNITTTAVPIPA